ncbi:hypothetical protein Tdes44962_MAKER05032 [Teratosphaeria destructans]|uniref:Alpha-galactosidase n=1 Tax=Teratosphaeria destructans TaxID=418781 RepID=A0A9W7SKX9_9PEZI|nr:hypothetical protein Tdes44962_MAKER05032 [Teratosphaeria destructans]
MRLGPLIGGFLLLRSASSLPSPPASDDNVPTLQAAGEQLERISHLETRGTFGDLTCFGRFLGGSSSRVVELDTQINWSLSTPEVEPRTEPPPGYRFYDLIGSRTLSFLALRRPILGSEDFTGVVWLRNLGQRTRHVSLIRSLVPGEDGAGQSEICVGSYEVRSGTTTTSITFDWLPSASYVLRLND